MECRPLRNGRMAEGRADERGLPAVSSRENRFAVLRQMHLLFEIEIEVEVEIEIFSLRQLCG